VGELEGVRGGNVVACGIPGEGGEEVLLVLEASAAGPLDELADRIGRMVRTQHQVPVRDVVIVEKGTLPKTTSGKLRRQAARAAYEASTLRTTHASTGAAGGRAVAPG
jgi:acyl-CoA synthetase (AMP-forming)/AMP-acid ligase II